MTAIENKDKLDEEVTQTFQNNFYVDHQLNSMENEDMSVQLMKKVTGICYEGGFNLTKFTR